VDIIEKVKNMMLLNDWDVVTVSYYTDIDPYHLKKILSGKKKPNLNESRKLNHLVKKAEETLIT
jgi:hypothetical protein